MTARVRALALAALLCLAPAVGVAAAAPSQGADASTGSPLDGADSAAATPDPPALQADPDDEANNTTVQHRDPDAVGEDGDLGAVKGWLSNRMLSSLERSSIEITQGEYERGRALLGDEYDGFLSKYVDVAGDTDGSTDDETADALNDTRDTQREYAETVQEYEETYEAYQAAKANGNDARARALARELDSLATELEGLNRALAEDYETLGNLTGEDLSTVVERFDSRTANVTAQAAEVTAAELVETRLSVTANASTTSFGDPLGLTGRLEAAGDEPLPDAVTITVAGTRRTVELDDDGTFSVAYRPETTATGERDLRVTYVPDPESVFVASNATVPVTVEAATPTVSLAEATERAAFGETVRVAGSVAVDGTAVGAGVPVALVVDGERLGTTRTDADGSFAATATLPATIEPGDVDVVVRAGADGRAIAASDATTTLAVAESETTLSVSASERADGDAAVAGTLETADGTAVPGRTVAILVDGERVATARTDADGAFDTIADVPGDADAVTVEATFDGAGTNLAPASARTELALDGAGAGDDGGDGGDGGDVGDVGGVVERANDGPLAAIAGGVVGLAVLAAAVVLWRRRGDDATPVASDPAPGGTESADDAPSLAERIEAGGDADASAVVRTAYAALRDAVADAASVPAAATHWEFYRAAVADRPGIEDDLRRVVEAYERAVFAERGVDDDAAGEARDAAVRVAAALDDAAATDGGSDRRDRRTDDRADDPAGAAE